MKWFIVLMFYYSCYSPNELEIIYEGSNDFLSYSYLPSCGSEVYEADVSEDFIEDEPPMEEPEPVFIPWKLW